MSRDAVEIRQRRGARIAYRVEGSGPPVVLIGGTGYSGYTWHPEFCRRVAERWAHGRRPPRHRRQHGDYTTQLFAEDAVAVLDHAGIEGAHVLGHSMGGRVAQLMAPLTSRISSLVLASSGAGFEKTMPIDRVGIPPAMVADLVRSGYDRDYFRAAQLKTFWTDDYATGHPEEVEWLADAFWSKGPGLDDYLRHVQARQAHSSWAVLPDLKLPVFVFVGELDTHRGGTGSHVDGARALHEALPDSELQIVPGLKHGVFRQAPVLTAELVLGWVTRHEASRP